MVHGLSCSMACGILVPRPGIEPMSSALQGGFSTTGYQWKSPCANFCVEICFQFSLPVEMLGRMVTLFIHLKNCQPVFLVSKNTIFFFTIPPAVYGDPSVSTSSATLAIVCLFDFSHPSGCE